MNRPKKVPLTGAEKIAILMNVVGEDKAFAAMKEMKDSDVRRLLHVMGQMKKAPIALVNAVIREFIYKLSEHEEIVFEENLSRPEVVSKALGEERAKVIFGTVKNVNMVDRKQLAALDQVDVKTLAEYLVEEHPQTIALILTHMDMAKQMALVKQFPDAIRTEVIMRMANLEPVASERVDELDEVLKKDLVALGVAQKSQYGGIAAIAELINNLDKKTMNSIMTRLEDKDPLLAEEIRQHMFTFTDISKIDDRGIQLILREVPNDRLLLALKSAPEDLRQKIYGAMSERASQILKEDLDALGPQKVSEVEAAQREVVKIVRRLEEEGKIVIGIGEETEIIE
ncbi:MAG: flagellar motor switch protein FliG [Deltaproteobacteria bacterium]|nr:flagellar motor switch protein FliG [Deltaproteobacteria bacterium]